MNATYDPRTLEVLEAIKWLKNEYEEDRKAVVAR